MRVKEILVKLPPRTPQGQLYIHTPTLAKSILTKCTETDKISFRKTIRNMEKQSLIKSIIGKHNTKYISLTPRGEQLREDIIAEAYRTLENTLKLTKTPQNSQIDISN